MDAKTHEATYRGFVTFAEIGTAVVVCWVLALAVGGIKHAWLTAIFGVILSGIAGAIGAFMPALGVRAPAAVAVLLALLLLALLGRCGGTRNPRVRPELETVPVGLKGESDADRCSWETDRGGRGSRRRPRR